MIITVKNNLGSKSNKLEEHPWVLIPSLDSMFKIISFDEDQIQATPCFDPEPLDEFECKWCPINGVIIEPIKVV